jgi:endonuclease YncB( thermonuclease family)
MRFPRAFTFLPLLPLLPLLFFASTASAVETTEVEVLSVLSGMDIVVQAEVGGKPCPLTVRLSCIVAEEPDFGEHKESPSAALLRRLVPPGSKVTLQSALDNLESDSSGRVKAIICQDVADAADGPAQRRCLQRELIAAGWAKFDPGKEIEFASLFHLLEKAQHEAQSAKRGMWAK